MASLLMICRKAPYGSSYAREAIDIALAASAFEVKVAMLFTDDGVLQLLKGQNTANTGSKNVEAVLSSLPLYEVAPILVNEDALAQRNLIVSDLNMAVELCRARDISALCEQYDRVLSI